MSQENVAIVLAAYEWASKRRELNLNDVLEQDFEWHTRRASRAARRSALRAKPALDRGLKGL